MTGRPGHAVNALDPRSANQKQMGLPIQFVAGQRAYRDSVRRRVNYNVMYGRRLLRDAPLAPVARGAHVVAIQWNGLRLLIDHSTLRRQSMRAGSHHTPIHTCPFKETLRYSTTMR